MDGVWREEFDVIDHFIARHALNLDVAERAMETPPREIARMLAGINVPRATILELAIGCTPAKLVAIVQAQHDRLPVRVLLGHHAGRLTGIQAPIRTWLIDKVTALSEKAEPT